MTESYPIFPEKKRVPDTLFATGLYLFVLPYATKWGSGLRTD